MKERPLFITNWRAIEAAEYVSPASGEVFGRLADFGRATRLTRLKMLHLTLPPGTRSNAPGAYRDEEEFVFVIEGKPDLWVDGHLYGLREGDGAWFNDRTGIGHTVLNNTNEDARLFVFGEGTRLASQFAVSLDSDAATARALAERDKLWRDPPARRLGPHDGITERVRGAAMPNASRKRGRPPFVANWRDILETKAACYPGSMEEQGIDAKFGKRARFSRIGIHIEVLKPGRRTSYPHAERDEEEFVYVVSGRIDCWLDGHIHPMRDGDFVGWEAGTGITHVVLNNSDANAILLVGGEASRWSGQCWYPYHPSRKKQMGVNYWDDHPIPKLDPHDGLPDALRERVPAGARKSALTANTAVLKLRPSHKKRRK